MRNEQAAKLPCRARRRILAGQKNDDFGQIGQRPEVIAGRRVTRVLARSAKAKAESGPLNALLNELSAQRGKHVTEAGHVLLSQNTAYLLKRP